MEIEIEGAGGRGQGAGGRGREGGEAKRVTASFGEIKKGGAASYSGAYADIE